MDSNIRLRSTRLQPGHWHRTDLWRLSMKAQAEVNHLIQHSYTTNGKQTQNSTRVCLLRTHAPLLLFILKSFHLSTLLGLR